jgi:hypothetical protein
MRFFTSFRMTDLPFMIITTQPLDRAIQRKKLDTPVPPKERRASKPENDSIKVELNALRS